jgi:septal ring factor EnvC (AmiA/AmiB activator)
MAKMNLAFAIAALAATPLAFAQSTVWKCVDADGRSHYTNVKEETKGTGCKVVSESKVSTVPATKLANTAIPTPTNFPKVDKDTQKARDDGRRKILEDELAAETRNLEDAKSKLAEQEAIRNGDEKNYQKVLDRLKPLQDTVERHEKNVAALQKEIGNLR